MPDVKTQGDAVFNGGGGQKPSPYAGKPISGVGNVFDGIAEFGAGVVGDLFGRGVKQVAGSIAPDRSPVSASFDQTIEPGITNQEQAAQGRLFGLDLSDTMTQIALVGGAVGLFLLVRKS